MKGRFSVRKLFLNLLILVCIAVPIWMAFQIFVSHTIPLAYGGIILAVDIGVLIWNISVLRHYSHETPSFWLMTLVIVGCLVILSFVGVQPLTDYRESATDWASTRIGDISCSTTSVAEIGKAGMWVSLDVEFYLYVELVPTSLTQANKLYKVNLYEKGELRATGHISWSEAELNVQTYKNAAFPISSDEYFAYSGAQSTFAGNNRLFGDRDDNGWWKDIFSVEVHE